MLIAVESALEGVPLIHCFDWLAGTSTGGILALGLASGILFLWFIVYFVSFHALVFLIFHYYYYYFLAYLLVLILTYFSGKSLLECQCIYFRMKEQVFKGKRPYNSEPLEKMLQSVLGEHTTMSQIQHPK